MAHHTRILLLLLFGLLLLPVAAWAQGDTPVPEPQPTRDVSLDEVNDVASQLYCPVCENEPLDTCMATSCVEWRREIRSQLAQGLSHDEVIQSFLDDHGDQVLPIPRDDGLRVLTFIGPIGVVLVVLGVGWVTLSAWQRPSTAAVASDGTAENSDNEMDDPDAAYRSLLEQDLDDD